jgi:hypothetical protein
VTTGITCANAERGCQGIATPEHPECFRCTRERKLTAMRQSGSVSAQLRGWLIEHISHRDLEVMTGNHEPEREAGYGICQPERGTIAGVLLSGGFLLFGLVIGWVDP